MDISTRKLAFLQRFLPIQDEAVLARLEAVLDAEGVAASPFPWDEDRLHQAADAALEDEARGRETSAKDLLAKMQAWSACRR